jgi:hypothetical protein
VTVRRERSARTQIAVRVTVRPARLIQPDWPFGRHRAHGGAAGPASNRGAGRLYDREAERPHGCVGAGDGDLRQRAGGGGERPVGCDPAAGGLSGEADQGKQPGKRKRDEYQSAHLLDFGSRDEGL